MNNDPVLELFDHYNAMFQGRYVPAPWAWHNLTVSTQALLPDAVTVVCGDPGCSKTFMMLQAFIYWVEHDIPCAYFDLEESNTYLLKRALAQLENNSNLFDAAWSRDHEPTVLQALKRQQNILEKLGNCITTVPENLVRYGDVIAWIRDKAPNCRVVVIDPITAADAPGDIWTADKEFVRDCKQIAQKHKCSIVIVTHPAKGRGNFKGIYQLSGGTAMSRFVQTVLWIEREQPGKNVMIVTDEDKRQREEYINRRILLSKVRNGSMGGSEIGYYFNGQTLKFEEKGFIE